MRLMNDLEIDTVRLLDRMGPQHETEREETQRKHIKRAQKHIQPHGG